MKTTCLILASAGVLLAGEPATFTGVITDTLCGRTHSMMKMQSDESCVKMCVKGSGEYALIAGGDVLKLSDQKMPAKFLAKPVKVTGTYEEKAKRIKVVAIEPADAEAAK